MKGIINTVVVAISLFTTSAFAGEARSSCIRKINWAAFLEAQAHFDLEALRYVDTVQFGNVFRVSYHYRDCEVWADVTVRNDRNHQCQILKISVDSDDGSGDVDDPFCR
jgi:hypothetical protein